MIKNLLKITIGLCLSTCTFMQSSNLQCTEQYQENEDKIIDLWGDAGIHFNKQYKAVDKEGNPVLFEHVFDVDLDYDNLTKYASNNSNKEIIPTPHVDISDYEIKYIKEQTRDCVDLLYSAGVNANVRNVIK